MNIVVGYQFLTIHTVVFRDSKKNLFEFSSLIYISRQIIVSLPLWIIKCRSEGFSEWIKIKNTEHKIQLFFEKTHTGCAINIFTIKKLNCSFSCQNYRADFFIGDKGVFKVFIYNTIINGYGFKLSFLISIRKCNILHWLKIVPTGPFTLAFIFWRMLSYLFYFSWFPAGFSLLSITLL
jgi:hypothetical protein